MFLEVKRRHRKLANFLNPAKPAWLEKEPTKRNPCLNLTPVSGIFSVKGHSQKLLHKTFSFFSHISQQSHCLITVHSVSKSWTERKKNIKNHNTYVRIFVSCIRKHCKYVGSYICKNILVWEWSWICSEYHRSFEDSKHDSKGKETVTFHTYHFAQSQEHSVQQMRRKQSSRTIPKLKFHHQNCLQLVSSDSEKSLASR